MAKKSMIAKAKREPKFSTRQHNRCTRCGRPRAYPFYNELSDAGAAELQ